MRALYAFTASGDTEMSFAEGDMMDLLEEGADGWMTCQKGAQKGLVPSNYVQKV